MKREKRVKKGKNTSSWKIAAAMTMMVASGVSVSLYGAAQTPSEAGMTSLEVSALTCGELARARSMFGDGDYQGAGDALRRVLCAPVSEEVKKSAKVLLARTLLMLHDPECVSFCKALREEYGVSPAGTAGLLTEGDWYFFAGNYGPASLCYEKVADLDSRSEYAYRQGVSLLYVGHYAQGEKLLEPIAAGRGSYSIAARYFLAWSEYAQGRKESARKGFEAVMPLLASANAYSTGVDGEYLPTDLDARYYLVQMDFSDGKFASASRQAMQMLEKGMPEQFRIELNRIAGEGLFRQGDYSQAEPYLRAYMQQKSGNGMATARYALGAIAYGADRDQEARALLEPISGMENVTGQGAALLLGQLEADNGNYTPAALYFEKAWRNGYDRGLAERALYNYISAMSHGAETPFASVTELPEQFLSMFPGSKYESAVREYLTAAYYRDKDYERALENLNKISNLTASQRKARQLVLYELGSSELSNGEYAKAQTHLEESTKGPDSKVSLQAQLWLGQALYAQGKFQEAEQAYQRYLRESPSGENAAQARYDSGYALYMQDKFKEAAAEFTKALGMKELPVRLRTDAKARLADCKYYQHDYASAATLYREVEQAGDGDGAYASMRAAMMEGLRGDLVAEISGLRRMTATYPDSKWTPSAYYELATALSKNGEMTSAADTYASIVEKWPHQEIGRRAQLQLATLYAKANEDDRAIEAYKELIRRWPTSEEAKAANVELRRLMSERGEVTAYADFMNSVPGAPKVDNAELEKLSYEAADNKLIESASDMGAMKEYLSRYPNGLYVAAGLLRLARAQAMTGKYAEALATIDDLAARRPDARELPEALMLRAEILERQYPAKRQEALAAWKEAERLLGAEVPSELYGGVMRLTDNASERLDYARRLKSMGSLSSEEGQQADYYEAQALEALGKRNEAKTLYKTLSQYPSSLYGAMGAVALGELLIKEKQYSEAEKVLESFTTAGTPHSYWLARGYIALADAVGAQGRKSLAREYLNALKSNYPGEENDIYRRIEEGLKKYAR